MTIVITGASRGIGAGLAEAYRARGREVLGTGRSAAAEVTLDVTRPADHRALAERLGDRAVELLVCNAGVFLDRGNDPATGYGADLWARSFATNVTGVFLAVQALLPHLRRAEAAKVCIIASQMGSSERATGGSLIYRASKAAAINLGRNLAQDLAGEGIAVGIYHPGWVRTDMGGQGADLSTQEAVDGLMARFDALSLDRSGVFETWDGRAHPF